MNKIKLNLFLLAILGVIQCGCFGPSRHSHLLEEASNSNLKKSCNAYMLYASRFKYTGPKSKEDLKNFLTTNESIEKNLDRMGIDREKIDEYFVSENDGEEFDFRWGVYINPDLQRSREPLVFEKTGKDGVRLVMLSNRKILEVRDDAKYAKLMKGKVSKEDAKTDAEKEEEEEMRAASAG